MKFFEIDESTFGNKEEFPCLIILLEELKKLDFEAKKSVCRFLGNVNKVAAQEDILKHGYFYKLTREDFRLRVRGLQEKYNLPEALHRRMDNYAKAKFTNVYNKRGKGSFIL